MPIIGDSLPLGVTPEKVKGILAVILTNRQTSHRSHKLTRDNLLACTSETVALVNV